MEWGIKQGARLAELRMNLNYSQKYIAQKIGVNSTQISKWETGKCCPRMRSLHDMAFLYHVTVEEITGEDVNFKPLAITLPYTVPDRPEEKTESGDVLALISMLTGKTEAEIIDEAVREYALSLDWQTFIRQRFFDCNTP